MYKIWNYVKIPTTEFLWKRHNSSYCPGWEGCQGVKSIVLQTWQPGFNPWNSCKGRKRTKSTKSLSDFHTSTMVNTPPSTCFYRKQFTNSAISQSPPKSFPRDVALCQSLKCFAWQHKAHIWTFFKIVELFQATLKLGMSFISVGVNAKIRIPIIWDCRKLCLFRKTNGRRMADQNSQFLTVRRGSKRCSFCLRDFLSGKNYLL